jgi:hypothetical protein
MIFDFRALVEDQPQFLLAMSQLALRDWIEVQDSLEQPIGQPVEQPYGRLEGEIEESQRPTNPQSRRHRLADSEGFRREFAQDAGVPMASWALARKGMAFMSC